MDAKASPRLQPLPHDRDAELKPGFEAARQRMGFIPNSQLILQRRPQIVKAFRQFTQAIGGGADSKVDAAMRALITLACCSVTREPYVWSHAAHALAHADQEAKLAAFNDYRASPLFSDRERATIEYARAASTIPCGVTDDLIAAMRRHWSEEEIVDITTLIGLYGFFDRYNAAMATPLEPEVREIAQRYLAREGWSPGRHAT
jgi:alkylhydroperoxidase family enzyme